MGLAMPVGAAVIQDTAMKRAMGAARTGSAKAGGTTAKGTSAPLPDGRGGLAVHAASRAGVRIKVSDMAEANRGRVFKEAGAKANSVEPRKKTSAITTMKTTITGATNNCGNSTKTMTSGETNAGRSSRRTSTNGVHPGWKEPKDRGQPIRQI